MIETSENGIEPQKCGMTQMRSLSISIVPIFLLLSVFPCSVSADELDKFLGGTWIVTSSETDGVVDGADSFLGSKVQFYKDGIMVIQDAAFDDPEVKVKFKVNLKSRPMEIDVFHDGEKAPGIFKWIMSGNEFQLCIRGTWAAGKGRPKKFKTSKGSDLQLLKLKRR